MRTAATESSGRHVRYLRAAAYLAQSQRFAEAADCCALGLHFARKELAAADAEAVVGRCQRDIRLWQPTHVVGRTVSAPLLFAQLLLHYPEDAVDILLDQAERQPALANDATPPTDATEQVAEQPAPTPASAAPSQTAAVPRTNDAPVPADPQPNRTTPQPAAATPRPSATEYRVMSESPGASYYVTLPQPSAAEVPPREAEVPPRVAAEEPREADLPLTTPGPTHDWAGQLAPTPDPVETAWAEEGQSQEPPNPITDEPAAAAAPIPSEEPEPTRTTVTGASRRRRVRKPRPSVLFEGLVALTLLVGLAGLLYAAMVVRPDLVAKDPTGLARRLQEAVPSELLVPDAEPVVATLPAILLPPPAAVPQPIPEPEPDADTPQTDPFAADTFPQIGLDPAAVAPK